MKMNNYPYLLLLSLCVAGCQSTQIPVTPIAGDSGSLQTVHHFEIQQTRTLATDYLLFLPADYETNSARRWPLILFLHGAGERGDNIWAVAKHGVPKIDTKTPDFPFIVVSPQCPAGKVWSQDTLLALLDDIEQRYAVDTHRVYLTGLSMGGFGTWMFGLSHADRFAAIAPIAGGGDVIEPFLATGALAQAIRTMPVWAFHGAKDHTVPLEESERMVMFMRGLGAKEIKLTVYPEAQHDSWTQTYTNAELYAWFLKHTR
jgi:predicted peptidase